MKTISRIFLIIISFVFISCTGGGGGGGTDMAEITIDFGSRGSSQSGFTTMLSPDDISSVRIVISGEGIDPDITVEQDVSGIDGTVVTIKVPIGPERRFQVLAFDSEGKLLYTGEVTVPVTESTRIVTITLRSEGFCEFTEVPYEWEDIDGRPLHHPNSLERLSFPFPFYGLQYDRVSSGLGIFNGVPDGPDINIDENGNIWFAYNGSASGYELPWGEPQTNSPVISPWNMNLTSGSNSGGFYVQNIGDDDDDDDDDVVPGRFDVEGSERFVVEWDLPAAEDGSEGPHNIFQAVLYPNGDIRFNYNEFGCCNEEQSEGSTNNASDTQPKPDDDDDDDDDDGGISNGDGENFISILDEFLEDGEGVEALEQRSFYYTACMPYISNREPEDRSDDNAFNSNVRMTLHSPIGLDFETFNILLTCADILPSTKDGLCEDDLEYDDEDTDVVSKSGTPNEYDVLVEPDLDFPEGEDIRSIVDITDTAGYPLIHHDWVFDIERGGSYED